MRSQIAVVGNGVFGIAAAAALSSDGNTDVVWISRDAGAGGLWQNVRPDMKLLNPVVCQTYPPRGLRVGPLRYGSAASHLDGLHAAAAAVTVRPNVEVRFERSVVAAELDAARKVQLHSRSRMGEVSERFDFVAFAIGRHHKPRMPDFVTEKVRPAIHSSQWRRVNAISTGQSIAVVGGGQSAVDIVEHLLLAGHSPQDLTWVRPDDSVRHVSRYNPLVGGISCLRRYKDADGGSPSVAVVSDVDGTRSVGRVTDRVVAEAPDGALIGANGTTTSCNIAIFATGFIPMEPPQLHLQWSPPIRGMRAAADGPAVMLNAQTCKGSSTRCAAEQARATHRLAGKRV